MSETFPISYWGSILYFQELVRYEHVVLEALEHFPKQTHRNRFSIVSASGELVLTAPVTKPNGNKTFTKDIELITDKSVLLKNWRAITSAYASSPFFDHYEKELSELFLNPNSNLLQHCVDINSFLLKCWGFDVKFTASTSFDWKTQSAKLEVDFLKKELENHSIYDQVLFKKDQEFVQNASSLDLLCNMGPLGRNIILSANH